MKWSMLLCSCCVAVLSVPAGATILANGGFEEADCAQGIPTAFGYWTGNDIAEVVGPENGIAPFEGTRMLRFITTGGQGNTTTTTSNINQAIDLSPWNALIETGRAELIVSGWFNRIHVDDWTDTLFGIEVGAYAGALEDLASTGLNPPYSRTVWLETDRATDTWELVGKKFVLPDWTRFVVVEIMAHENVYNDIAGQGEFDGHYADMISLEIVPEPGTLLLLGLGGLSVLRAAPGRSRVR